MTNEEMSTQQPIPQDPVVSEVSQDTDSLLPVIEKKYTVILILLILTTVMISSYVTGVFLGIAYGVLALLLVITYGLKANRRFRKLNKKLRPFVVTRIAEYISIVFGVFLLVVTVPAVIETPDHLIPHVIFWLLYGAIVWSYYSIFAAAHQHKQDHPERCEFC